MKELTISTKSRSYPIYFGTSFDDLADSIIKLNKAYSRIAIITDSHVGPLYGQTIAEALSVLNIPIQRMTFTAGEEHKTLQTIETFYTELIQSGAGRKTLIVALGGGVTGDMAGYTAATYMRGIDFIQVPTSLLAQVDSSVGGKTGVDLNGYKNIVGAFYQPMLVYMNVSVLGTLPDREFYSGMSEIIKHAIIRDASFITFLEEQQVSILNQESDVLIEMLYRSCHIKKDVVDQDETEHSIRGLLNFGHTYGHSIERLKNFEHIHGECVAIGMHGALRLSGLLGYLEDADINRCLNLIQGYQLPITTTGLNSDTLYKELFYDKKTDANRLVFAIIPKLGESFLNTDTIEENLVKQGIMYMLDDDTNEGEHHDN